MLDYNLMQITPGSGARLCSYLVPDTREDWKQDESETAVAMRELLPASVVDCESNWEYLISVIGGSPKAAEMIRTDQVTDVRVSGERATATLSFGGTFEWLWHDGRWMMNKQL